MEKALFDELKSPFGGCIDREFITFFTWMKIANTKRNDEIISTSSRKHCARFSVLFRFDTMINETE